MLLLLACLTAPIALDPAEPDTGADSAPAPAAAPDRKIDRYTPFWCDEIDPNGDPAPAIVYAPMDPPAVAMVLIGAGFFVDMHETADWSITPSVVAVGCERDAVGIVVWE